MKIKGTIIKEIIEEMPIVPPESGGIIGGRNGIVSIWFHDKREDAYGCNYAPDVIRLNSIVEQWEREKYEFMGMFHVHFWGVKSLSRGDEEYIEQIMRAMPKEIEKLYFPIILQPQKKCITYVACKGKNGKILIRQDKLEIFD